MEDIAPKLQEQILTEFKRRTAMDFKIKSFNKKLEQQKATQKDAYIYTVELGKIASSVLKEILTEDNLPNGTMFWNIAERTVKPLLEEVHKRVNEAASDVQKLEDSKQKIGLIPVSGEWPEQRVHALIQKMSNLKEEMDGQRI